MGERIPRKLGLKEDWASVPFLLIVMAGWVVAVYDFWKFQGLRFQLNAWTVTGVALLVFGGVLRLTSRRTLMKAGFGLVSSSRLQIVEDQRLVTDGVYRHIRHPLYLGEMARNLGVALVLSSAYGSAIVLLGNLFLLFRIPIEEEMLVEEFGDEYEEYRKRTKKLIPYVF
ncbi:MAG: isoprenylcysteine carboxylmethyltransferase family protein [Candidatus Bathyarchaeota archaeon]|nr:MAG: isoprenylcysteine carboxylmethyltransferase family protein [Candidatus Bathyarchaeota archaeon]